MKRRRGGLQYLKDNNKLLEEQRISQRTQFDIEMMTELGFCSGIENYSRYLSGRNEGEALGEELGDVLGDMLGEELGESLGESLASISPLFSLIRNAIGDLNHMNAHMPCRIHRSAASAPRNESPPARWNRRSEG